MTPGQFTALAQLMRLRQGPAQEAARLALVEGATATQAAEQLGISYALAWKSIDRAKQALELAKEAAG